MKKLLTNPFPLNNMAYVQSSHGAASCPAIIRVMRKGGFLLVEHKARVSHVRRRQGAVSVRAVNNTRAFFIF